MCQGDLDSYWICLASLFVVCCLAKLEQQFQFKTIIHHIWEEIRPEPTQFPTRFSVHLNIIWSDMFGCFDPNQSAKKALVAYSLWAFSDFPTLPHKTRVEMRFVFNAFANKMLTPEQLRNFVSSFASSLTVAAEKLIQVCISPGALVVTEGQWSWTKEETLLAFAGNAFDSDESRISQLLPGRTSESKRHRIRRVLSDMESEGMLTDEIAPMLQIVNTGNVTIKSVDQRTMQPRRITQGMRLQKAIQKKERDTAMQSLRDRKKLRAIISCSLMCTPPDTGVDRDKTVTTSEDHQQQDEDVTESQELFTKLAREFELMSKISPRGRRYSDLLLDVGELLHATSRKTYQILRQLLPLPSETTLHDHYSTKVSKHKLLLTDIKLLDQHLKSLLANGIIEKEPVTIGIDAFSIRTFTGTVLRDGSTSTSEYSNVFIFLHIPLNPMQKPIPLYLHPKENGSYDDTIAQIFTEIKACYARNKIPIWFKATDGDRYLSDEHDDFFNTYVAPHRNDFQILVEKIHDVLVKGVVMPIPDPLHYGKNIRGKLLDHYVALVNDVDNTIVVNWETLQSVLDLGAVLDDHSHLGRMRDVHVTRLFTLQNVCKLLKKGDYAGSFLLLPYSSIFTVLYGINVATETRLFFVHLAYLCFNAMLDQAQELVKEIPDVQHRFSKGVLAVTIAEPNYIRRMIHSCLALGISLFFGPNSVRLDGIGTHLVENCIGVARSVANSTKFDNILSSFATSEIRKEIARKYHLQLRVSRRINDGGAKVNTLDEYGIRHEQTWDPHDIVSMFIEACKHDLVESAGTDLSDFLEDLSEFLEELSVSELPETSDVSNALIVQRNIRFKAKSKKGASQ